MVAAAQALEREIIVLEADSPSDIETVFVAIVEQQAGALIVGPFISLNTPLNRPKIIELAARYAIPAMYPNRVYADFGGLMSYSAGGRGAFRQLGAEYVAPILRGAKPADLPVRRSTKFELVINRKTAKALSLTVPLILLAMADEVIE